MKDNRIPTRPRCHRCQRYITIDTHADADLWAEVIGPTFGPGYICADCFTRAADERLIAWEGRVRLVPLSLASQMKHQAAALTAQGDAEQGGEAVELTKCCGREECGGECGNEWRGMEWVRKATPKSTQEET